MVFRFETNHTARPSWTSNHPLYLSSQCFSLFFTTTFLQFIALHTNQYTLECMGGEKYAQWTQVTVTELQAYMGFMILMGIVHLPSIYDYWKKDDYSPVASLISRDRFFELYHYLHFANNSSLSPPGDPGYDKFGKIRPVMERLREVFRTVYYPHKNVSVDEAMILFKGRSTLKQYMPQKPTKRGIKVWAMSDAINGYVSEFDVYTGRKR